MSAEFIEFNPNDPRFKLEPRTKEAGELDKQDGVLEAEHKAEATGVLGEQAVGSVAEVPSSEQINSVGYNNGVIGLVEQKTNKVINKAGEVFGGEPFGPSKKTEAPSGFIGQKPIEPVGPQKVDRPGDSHLGGVVTMPQGRGPLPPGGMIS